MIILAVESDDQQRLFDRDYLRAPLWLISTIDISPDWPYCTDIHNAVFHFGHWRTARMMRNMLHIDTTSP